MSETPRLVPDRAFPAYAFTGSPQPHPVRDPRGHSHGVEEEPADPLEADSWPDNGDYLFGLDLFNHGYYWEAHEAWEGVWIAGGKKGPVAEFLKGLIKLTAAGVKARQGMPAGVEKHSEKALEHFERASEGLEGDRFAGFTFRELEDFARHVREHSESWISGREEGPRVVFDRVLIPAPEAGASPAGSGPGENRA